VDPDRDAPQVASPSDRALLASQAAAAAVVHLVMVPAHADEWLPEGIAFALVGWVQLGLAVSLLVRPSRRVLWAALGVSVTVVGAWAWSRMFGLPVGPSAGHAEPAESLDLLCATVEGLTALGAAVLLTGRRLAPRSVSRFATVLPGLAVLGVTTAVLASPAGLHTHADGEHDDHDHGVEVTEVAGIDEVAAPADEANDHVHTDASAELAAAGADPGASPAADVTAAGDQAAHAHGTGDDGTAVPDAPSPTAAGDGHHHAACDTPVSPDQSAAAFELAAATQLASERFTDLADAEAAGYVPITPPDAMLVHYGNPVFMADGVDLDPERPESLLYVFGPDDRVFFVGAMFLWGGEGEALQPGGCLTQWHDHTDLCLAPGVGMVGFVDADGRCPEGSVNEVTPVMLHVWTIPMPGGPFSEIDTGGIRDALIHEYLPA
jgi:hypothetical protein